MNRKTKGGQFIPFEIVKDKEVRKSVSSSFHATSRDAWQSAHASKTNPPEVGKYKPKNSVVWAKSKATVIRKTPPNEGTERKLRQGLQQMRCVDRIIKKLDTRVYTYKHDKFYSKL